MGMRVLLVSVRADRSQRAKGLETGTWKTGPLSGLFGTGECGCCLLMKRDARKRKACSLQWDIQRPGRHRNEGRAMDSEGRKRQSQQTPCLSRQAEGQVRCNSIPGRDEQQGPNLSSGGAHVALSSEPCSGSAAWKDRGETISMHACHESEAPPGPFRNRGFRKGVGISLPRIDPPRIMAESGNNH